MIGVNPHTSMCEWKEFIHQFFYLNICKDMNTYMILHFNYSYSNNRYIPYNLIYTIQKNYVIHHYN